ncbi:MAG: adenylate cyclase, partial [Verrucomicrobia bacterium]
RMNYTVMGNSVNLSARIESLTSHYGAQLLVCSETYRALKTSYRSRLIDKIRVKGQSTPASLYEILYAHSPEKEEEWLGAYASGLGAYETGNFKGAIAFFEKSLVFNPLDKASKILLSRCAILLERPQPDWDGVWSMESKSG